MGHLWVQFSFQISFRCSPLIQKLQTLGLIRKNLKYKANHGYIWIIDENLWDSPLFQGWECVLKAQFFELSFYAGFFLKNLDSQTERPSNL
jgi:hypothetical protein